MTVRPAVVVVGSLNRDYVSLVETLPRPGQTVLAEGASVGAGGKGGNQAVAASLTGARTVMVGNVGDDENGRALLAGLEAASVDTSRVELLPDVLTGMAFVVVGSDGENCIIVAPGANGLADPDGVTRRLSPLLGPDTVVVTQAEIPVETVEAVVTASTAHGCRLVLNLAPFRPLAARFLAPCDPLVLNETEAAALVGREVDGVEAALVAARELQGTSRSVVVTLGPQGAVVAAEGVLAHIPADPAPVVDTTGAGDAFTGAMASSLSRGDDLESAVRFGVKAGSYAVGRLGAQASYPTLADLTGDPATAGD